MFVLGVHMCCDVGSSPLVFLLPSDVGVAIRTYNGAIDDIAPVLLSLYCCCFTKFS